jgi:hypothetical protein
VSSPAKSSSTFPSAPPSVVQAIPAMSPSLVRPVPESPFGPGGAGRSRLPCRSGDVPGHGLLAGAAGALGADDPQPAAVGVAAGVNDVVGRDLRVDGLRVRLHGERSADRQGDRSERRERGQRPRTCQSHVAPSGRMTRPGIPPRAGRSPVTLRAMLQRAPHEAWDCGETGADSALLRWRRPRPARRQVDDFRGGPASDRATVASTVPRTCGRGMARLRGHRLGCARPR